MRQGMMAVLALVAAASPAAAAPAPDAAAIAWTRAHAIPIGDADSAIGPREAATIDALVNGARVIALGEPQHFHHEPLAYRNRLIRYLVARRGLRAIALESGLADTHAVDRYLSGEAPGDTKRVVFGNLSWGFNTLDENVALVRWLRDWNAAHPRDRVHLYGIDLSGGDEQDSFSMARRALDLVGSFLAQADARGSDALRARLAAAATRFTPEAYATLSGPDRAALDTLIADARMYLRVHRATLSRAGGGEYGWAVQAADDARDLVHVFTLWPSDTTRLTPGALAVAQFRDRIMATRTLRVLAAQPPRKQVLLFQSNSHVAAQAMTPIGAKLAAVGQVGPTGWHLRRALGSGYRVILTVSSLGRAPGDAAIGEVDSLLAVAAPPRALLDIRAAGPWWDRPHTLAHGGMRINAVVPKAALDGMIYIDRLSDAHRIAAEPAATIHGAVDTTARVVH